MNASNAAILHVEQLSARYGELQVLHEITFGIRAGSSLAIVGESGSGKTTLARCLSGLHPDFTGKILYQSETLAAQARDRRQVIRRNIQQIFQNPYGSLNPRKTIGSLISQPIRFFFRSSRRSARDQAALLLERVGLEADYLDRYPHELSGGERQRVAIARALAAQPKLLICDEVTSSLDVSVQATIVNLLRDLQREQQMAMLFITHNLSLVPNIAEDVLVIYEGRVVEAGPVSKVVNSPTAVYTRTLLSALGPGAGVSSPS